MNREPVFERLGKGLLARLRGELVPAVLRGGDDIRLTHPGADTDHRLGVFLHDLEEVRPYGVPPPVPLSQEERGFPDRLLALRFMLFANRKAPFDGMDALDEMVLLEAVIRAVHSMGPLEVDGQQVRVEFQALTRGEKTALWQSLNCPLQSAVYLTLEPVAIPSGRIRRAPVVREVAVSARGKEGSRR